MSIILQKEFIAKLKENRLAAEKELMQNLQQCLNDIIACGFVLTCDNCNEDKLDNAIQDFTMRSEAEFVTDNE